MRGIVSVVFGRTSRGFGIEFQLGRMIHLYF